MSGNITDLGVAAIRDGFRAATFSAREVAEASTARSKGEGASTPSSSRRPNTRSPPPMPPMQRALRAI
jgi:hypothetical protein